jgi:hypothetical protein
VIPDAPWAHPDSGRALTQHKLARLLHPFRIWPRMIGPESRRRKGYRRLQFKEAWDAYLSSTPTNSGFQTSHTSQSGGKPPVSNDFQSSHDGPDVSFENVTKPAEFCENVSCVSSEAPPPGGIPEGRGERRGNGAGAAGAPQPRRVAKKRSRPVSRVTQSIRATAAAHPGWKVKRIAKECGQPVTVVEQALDGWSRPNGADDA